MSRVDHFEINVDDPQAAVAFYRQVFGWEINRWEGPVEYWLVTTGEDDQPGINGAIMRREDPSLTTVNTISVSSVDDFLKKIESSGGTVVAPKMAVPGVGYMAYCQDPDGNRFGLMQEDPSAA